MQPIRAFIAIELSAEAQAKLADLQNSLKRVTPPQAVRWTSPAAIHLTLHFLGNMSADSLVQVTDLMRAVAADYTPFSLTLAGLGCFPNFRRPRIVWVGVSGQREILGTLQRQLGEQLQTIGFTPEARVYSPHLTLGRVKDRLPQQQLTQLGQALEQFHPQVGALAALRVAEVTLVQSELQPGGAVYTPLAAASLGK